MRATRLTTNAVLRRLPLLAAIAAVVLAAVAAVASASTGTFGVTTPGSTWGCPPADYKYGNAYSLAEPGSVSGVSAYMMGGGGAGEQAFKAMIFAADGAGGEPGTLLAVSGETTVQGTALAGWVDFPITPAVHLTAGTYWIVQLSGPSDGVGCLSDAGGGAAVFNADLYGDGPSDPFDFSGPLQSDVHRWVLSAAYTADLTISSPPATPAPASPTPATPAPATPAPASPTPAAPAPAIVAPGCIATPQGCLTERRGYCLGGKFLDLLAGQPEWDPTYRGAILAVFARGLGITCDAALTIQSTGTYVDQTGENPGPRDAGRVYQLVG